MKVYVVKEYDTVKPLYWIVKIFNTEEKAKKFIHDARDQQVFCSEDYGYEEWEVK